MKDELGAVDNRPLLERGCPVCGDKLKRGREIAPASWLAFFVLAALGVLISWVFLPIAILAPLASQAKVLKCGCGFKQRYG